MKTNFLHWEGKFLLADTSSDLLRAIKRIYPERMSDFIHVTTLGQFEEEIMEKKNDYKAIFLAPSFYEKNQLMGLELCHEFALVVPIYLFQDLQIKNSQMEIHIKELGIQQLLKSNEELFEIIKAIDINQELYHTWSMENQNISALDMPLENEEGFIAVKSEALFSGANCIYDLYVRLKSGKFLKISKSGDRVDFARLESYLFKGVSHFFILKDDQTSFMSNAYKLAQKIILKSRMIEAMEHHHTLKAGMETIEFLINNGLSSEPIDFVKNYINNVEDLLNSVKQTDPILGKLLTYSKLFEHSVSVAIIAGLLGRKRGLKSKQLVSTLGLACMLHDVGIYHQNEYNLGRPGRTQNTIIIDNMISESEIELALHLGDSVTTDTKHLAQIYTLHPTKGAKLVQNYPEFGPILDEIISQHHERPDGSGFPNGLIQDEISPLAIILGMSDEFVKFIQLRGGQQVSREVLFAYIDEMKGFPPDIRFDLKSIFA